MEKRKMKQKPSAEEIRVGERIIVTIKRLGINGEGVGYYRRKAVFIEHGLPGEVVKATVTRIETGHLYAVIEEREKSSKMRVTADCAAFRDEQCGGCQIQHLSYEGQLAEKTELVREAFARYCGDANPLIQPIIGMDDPWRYRNKAQFQLHADEKGRVTAGLYSTNSRKLLDLTDCPVQPSTINMVMRSLVELIQSLRLPIYNERARKAGLRSLVIRESHSGELQVTLVSSESYIPRLDDILRAILHQYPKIVSVAHNVNATQSPLVFGEQTRILHGADTLDMQLDGMTFAVSPRAFFQLNSVQAVKLYNEVKKAAALTGSEMVVDAYCGSGTIGLWLADVAGEIRGIETLQEAVLDARHNAKMNNIENATFHCGNAEQLLPTWIRKGTKPDVIIVDPPRTGCEHKLLQAIAHAKPNKLVYVSCNPSTLAKDCRFLLENGFKIAHIQPVDMFPHTAHVECVALLVQQ
jgi:23S rRNA (uracil1939-C5)-methyltransferase